MSKRLVDLELAVFPSTKELMFSPLASGFAVVSCFFKIEGIWRRFWDDGHVCALGWGFFFIKAEVFWYFGQIF